MKAALLTGFVTTVALAGTVAQAAPAMAFSWDNSWSQSEIYSKSVTGFNDAPYQKYVQSERIAIPNSGQFELDPNKLKLKFAHDVSVYFVNEGAGYRNQLAYQSTGTTNRSGLVFNDISSAESVGAWGGDALDLGDSVKLGQFAAGTQLDFWLRADGLNRGNGANIFGTKTESNADGLQHVVAYAVNQKYLLLGFEDLYGGLGATGQDIKTGRWNESSDRDFNDAVFVVDIGEANVKHLTSVPEPATTAALIGVGAVGLLRSRRQKAV